MGSTNQTPMGERHQARADQVLVMARRHADEIRAAAEEDAARILLDAEREGARRQEERLEAERRERARLAMSRSQIEASLDATVAAVTRIRELISALPSVEASQAIEITEEGSIRAAAAQPTGELAEWRNRIMTGVAVVLAVWAVSMVAILIVLPGRAADADVTATVAARTPAADVAPARADASAPARQAVPAVAPVPAPKIDVVRQRPGEDLGLTVAFVAARDCWISIATDDGRSNERLLRASERYVVRAREVVSFKAGNAGALSVLINDQPIGPLGGEGRVVARRITRENYLSFLES